MGDSHTGDVNRPWKPIVDLHWHCLLCGDIEPVEQPEPGQDVYGLGDKEPCACGGTAHVMTLKQGAAYEQGLAMGMSPRESLLRATKKYGGDHG